MKQTLHIEKIIHGGSGLGRLEGGLVVMVPFVLPGEKVEIKEKKRSKKFIQAELLEITQASPRRISPPCPYYTQCGGCNLQHIEYPEQLALKRTLLAETLARNKIPLTTAAINDTLPSPQPFAYRYRIRLHLDNKQRLGFHRVGSNQIIPISRCLLATDAINRSLHIFKTNYLDQKLAASWKSVEFIESPATGKITIVLHPRRHHSSNAPPLDLSDAADYTVSKNKQHFHAAHPPLNSPQLQQQFSLADFDYTLSWDSYCFFQTNVEQNVQLVAWVWDKLNTKKPTTLLDLFCGIGNFSVPLLLQGWQITGVEHNQRSIAWAKKNSVHPASTAAITYQCENVTRSLSQFKQKKLGFDVVLLDPPRQGLDREAVTDLTAMAPKKIVYISCDPATMARDLAHMCSSGYSVAEVTPVDMFPQTHHIESVIVLEKN
ncbi:class I SAM-dependent RNA methyltransferase [Desulfogranum marinum]|uniref:class I SAM-dependent RNA methyltransferase n=1 Tax=Desulfogranum marinum TaxID=453220 RepID=UPI0029C64D30|nr:class I SAM-dependent RNA methyltransferase [Desulfogranum marinum]